MKYRLGAASIATYLSVALFLRTVPADRLGISWQEALGIRLDTALSSSLITVALMCVFYMGN